MTKRELKSRYEELKSRYEELERQDDRHYTKLCVANEKNDYLCRLIEMYKYLAGINKESDTCLLKYNGKIFRVLSYETSKEEGYNEELVLRCKEIEIKNERIPV